MINLIYTSYFGFARHFDPNLFALIGIAGKSPTGWNGLEYKKLAPSWSIWNEWHTARQNPNNTQEDLNKINENYTKRFKQEILKPLYPMDVISDIAKLANDKIPVLLCYEKPIDFCHRHIVADWLNYYSMAMEDNNAGYDNNILVTEYK